MKSKFTLLVLLYTLSSLQLQAQKCKYDLDKKDPMTDERVRRITYSLKDYFAVSLYRRAEDMRAELSVRFGGERNFRVVTGEKIEIKLANGTILALTAAQDALPTSYVAARQIFTNYAITYKISEEQMRQIAQNGITVVRATLGGEELVYEASDKITKKSAAGATCILTD